MTSAVIVAALIPGAAFLAGVLFGIDLGYRRAVHNLTDEAGRRELECIRRQTGSV